ncbi:hypothetical protein TraAM80_03966 [Trypanosoma rangeli]|uniref:Uncharacterized protein n=1 Tax=Trypanosoma rangeli TaxID=5698 RepID=A0A3R7MQF0_TRYRA|nr:uncharacterized protein TraAM80_03966 [Trypanosoma rangeli]RNF06548.1 hypothetical protein TraAM80_03966 [Trypanosoma rangeli]|eukprot:RNF06548.1 hypothetical protein TraAM80_03966 [Trypanosoma rangeli]
MTAFTGNEKIIAYDSDGDDAGRINVAPHRAVSKRAEIVLIQQKSFRSVGGREAGRQQLTELGGAYGELCRGAPLSVWVVDPACIPHSESRGDKNEPLATTLLRTPEKNRNTGVDEIFVPNSKTGGRVCGYRSPLPKKKMLSSNVSDFSQVSTCKGSPLASQEPRRKNDSASSTAEDSPLLTPGGWTTTSLLSQAERSAVELLAHDVDGVARECWRESQQQLSPFAIYAEDDGLAFASAANTTSSGGRKKRKRLCEARDSVTPEGFADETARCLQFEPESCSMRPLRPSVSGMMQKRFNKLTQQRLALQCLLLPY